MTLKRALLDGYASSTLVKLYTTGDKSIGDPFLERIFFWTACFWPVFGLAISFSPKLNLDWPLAVMSLALWGVAVGVGFIAMRVRVSLEQRFVKACEAFHRLIPMPGCLEKNTLYAVTERYLIDKARESILIWRAGKRGGEHDVARAVVRSAYDTFALFRLNAYEISNYYTIAEAKLEQEAQKSAETQTTDRQEPAPVDEPVILGALPDDRLFPR